MNSTKVNVRYNNNNVSEIKKIIIKFTGEE